MTFLNAGNEARMGSDAAFEVMGGDVNLMRVDVVKH